MGDQRVVIVTGGNAGIGRATAELLAAEGHHVVIVSRDLAKGEEAANAIRSATGNEAIDVVQGNLSSMAETTALANRLLVAYPRIDVLINNAGVWMTQKEINADGLEMTFMVNHVAPYILSLRLMDRLKASAPARIVNVNAGLYMKGEMDLTLLPEGKNFSRLKTYMHSKLCNTLFTIELAKRIEGSGVTVNALHPGVINTNLGASRGPLGMLLGFAKRFWGAPEDGAKPIARLATDPGLESCSGKYYDVFEEHTLVGEATKPELATELWEYTEALTSTHLPD